MKFTMTETTAAAVLAFASTSALAVDEPFPNNGSANFTMYDSTGAVAGNFNDISGFVNYADMTFGVDGSTAFFGGHWTASGGALFGEGTHTVNVNGDGADAPAGSENVTFTVGAGQMGGNIDFAWGSSSGIDVFNVWDINTATNDWTSIDIDGDGTPGLGMVDGPFPGFSANFNFMDCMDCDWFPEEDVIPPSIPEASTYAMMLAGLGLVGFMARRRKQAAI